ncbi:exonuclease domain-containing protein [Halomonas piscis]|uniref:Excinuclease cho n=1 Tax=Halomonas piscis TaxID=3031727 RepID=A0ABY9YWK2_9GAMM|nr:exonuclease domain-containing protein [Halomonas piscis]WNK18861.1 exonuclease domain-containing protein [Halomonas piscis]
MPADTADPTPLVFLQVNASGTRPTRDRIIELAALRVENGAIVERRLQRFNPGQRVPAAVTALDDATLTDAASFEQAATELHSWLGNAILIAHNARVHHAFLRNAFKRAGIRYEARLICTRRLAQRLAPELAEQHLHALLAHYRIAAAPGPEGNVDALWALWQHWQRLHGEEWPARLETERRQQSLPAQLDADSLKQLPAAPGVYLFYGHNRLPLYVGKSVNLRRRVWGHFQSDHRHDREMRLARQVQHVEWEETAGDLSAQLREAELVKTLLPILNRQLRRQRRLTAWQWPDGAACPEAVDPARPATQPNASAGAPLYGLFRSQREARTTLQQVAAQHQLCPQVLGLERGRGRCFASQLGKCRGACCGRESLDAHARRARKALEPLRLDAWPWRGRIAVKEQHPASRLATWHVIWHWCYLGHAASCQAAARLQSESPTFDMDSYRILSRFLHDPARYGLEITTLD